MSTAVVIGRFQTDLLHPGHIHLLNYAQKFKEDLVVLIGTSQVGYSNRNPLPFEMRGQMVNRRCPRATVFELKDIPDDDVAWSEQIDHLLKDRLDVVIVGSRDSFMTSYKGVHPILYIPPYDSPSGSDIRESIKNTTYDSTDFRMGIIHAIENKFPVAYPTVDIAVIKFVTGPNQLLLGRKSGSKVYCFIGGFVDPNDLSLENAADRELHEEVERLHVHEYQYVGSTKIEDGRYRGTKDGIMTSFFMTYYMGGEPSASDDIEEVKWFDLVDFDTSILDPKHHPLFEMLKKKLKL